MLDVEWDWQPVENITKEQREVLEVRYYAGQGFRSRRDRDVFFCNRITITSAQLAKKQLSYKQLRGY